MPTIPRPLILAHRGLVNAYQENSLAAIQAALDHSDCDGAEFDVFLTPDNEVVVFHDENLLRLTGIDQSIYDTPWSELKNYELQKDVVVDGGSKRRYPTTQPISLLRDVLLAIKGKTNANGQLFFVDIELKAYSPNPLRYAVGREAAKIVKELNMAEQCVMSSFNYFMLIAAKYEYPALRTVVGFDSHMPLSADYLNDILETDLLGNAMGADAVIADYTLLDSDSVSVLNEKGSLVGSYTFFPLEASDALMEQQVQALLMLSKQGLNWIETDNIEFAAAILEEAGYR